MADDKKLSADSFLHEMNPAAKLVIFLALIQTAALSAGFAEFAVLTVLFIVLTYISGLSLTDVADRVKPFLILIFFTFLINMIFGSGLSLSAGLSFRFMLIILFSVLLTLTTEPKILASVILLPFRGRHGKNLKTVIMVALEFIPVFISEVKKTSAEIKSMPGYKKGTYRALFRPQLYLPGLISSLTERSAQVAEDVGEGLYDAPAVSKPSAGEIMLAAAAVILAVKYAV